MGKKESSVGFWFIVIVIAMVAIYYSYTHSKSYKIKKCQDYTLQLEHTVVNSVPTATEASVAIKTSQQQYQQCQTNWESW